MELELGGVTFSQRVILLTSPTESEFLILCHMNTLVGAPVVSIIASV